MAAVGVAGNKFPDQTAEIVRSRFKLVGLPWRVARTFAQCCPASTPHRPLFRVLGLQFLTDFSSDEFKGDSETEDFKASTQHI